MKLDGCADSNDYGDLQPLAVGGDPPFLFGEAPRHPQHIGVGLRSVLDCSREAAVFHALYLNVAVKQAAEKLATSGNPPP